jgi:DNA polymerase III subunit gamma/tau
VSHRALTLKYRPQTFSDLIGQEHVSIVLSRAIEGGRVAHAYLFTGARGVGKTTSARILAKSLNCQKRAAGELAGADPCNVCTSCLEITSGVSLDVAEIDGASNRGIADVQALREKVRFTPTGGKYRVVIIDEVHQLSNDAFAALLKTLEEPPPHLVFIFATTDPQKLPDTIRSRTQRFDFARVPLRKVADRLLEITRREAADSDGVHFTLDESAALLIAHKGEGSMRDAVSALDQVVSAGEPAIDEALVRRVLGLADREAFFALAGAIVARDPRAALRALHEAFDKGLDARDLADGLSEHIRHILILKVDPEGADLVAAGQEDLKRLRQQGEGWSEDDLLRLLRLASEASWPMRDSPQPLLHLEAAVLQMATLEPGELLADILARLQSLEQRLGGAPTAGGGASDPRGGGMPRPTSAPSPAAPRRSTAPGGAAPPPISAVAPPAFTPRAAPSAATGFSAPPVTAASPGPVSPVASRPAPAATSGAVATAAPELEIELDEQTQRFWREAIGAINGRKRMLGAFLDECRFLGVGGDAVVVAMDDLHRAVIEEKENRALVAEAVLGAFGRPLTLRCTAAAAGDLRRPPVLDDVKPMIDRAIEWFQGDVIERKDRNAERTNG